MPKYKPSLTEVEMFYIVALLKSTDCRFVEYEYRNADTVLIFLSSNSLSVT